MKLDDDSPMPWGKKFKGVPMKDVPVSYLHWIWESVNVTQTQGDLVDVRDYIYENMVVLKSEDKDRIWSKP